MRLDKMILKNFLTYDYLEYIFENRPLQVQGLNLTDDGQKTNGTGKSGIPTGIEFCITASNSRGVRDNELVTYGKKEAQAELFASCDMRKQLLHIDWTIKVKGSNKLKLKTKEYDSDEWVDVSFSNINDGKKFIIAWFAIEKEDLFNYYIINKTRFKSFFDSSNKEKVDLINRFSDASIVTGIEEIDTSALQEKLSKAERTVSECDGSITTLGYQIEKERSRDFKAELEEEIGDINEEIDDIHESIKGVKTKRDSIAGKIKEKKKEIKGIKEDIKTTKLDKEDIKAEIRVMSNNVDEAKEVVTIALEKVKNFDSTDWNAERKEYEDDVKEDYKNIQTEKKLKEKREKQKADLLKLISQCAIDLGGAITCPKCEHEWLPDCDIDEVKKKKKDSQKMIPLLDNAITKIDSSILKTKEAIGNIESDISSINKKEKKENEKQKILTDVLSDVKEALRKVERKYTKLTDQLDECDADIIQYNRDIDNIKTSITNIEASEKNFNTEIANFTLEIENYKTQIDTLKVGDSKERIKELKTDLKKVNKNKIIHEKEVIKISDEIYERNQWIANFKQFRMFLANQSLEVIEYHMNRYLDGMGSDMRVKMSGFKFKADGTMKEEITASIIRDIERTYNSYSGGEKCRLLFSSILSNRYMINQSHPYGGLDFLVIDEVFEGTDSLGLNSLVKSAKALGIAVMMITHVSDEEISSDTITVVKENGVSTIKYS